MASRPRGLSRRDGDNRVERTRRERKIQDLGQDRLVLRSGKTSANFPVADSLARDVDTLGHAFLSDSAELPPPAQPLTIRHRSSHGLEGKHELSPMASISSHPVVIRRSTHMSKQDGDRRPHVLSADDKAWILRRLQERKMSRAALAKAIGMSRQGIYALLGDGGYTWDWPSIVAALGGTPPSGVAPILDARLRNIVRRWPDLSDEARATMEVLSEQLRSKKP